MLIEVNPLLAFVAGLVSFVSPCVLPLVPAYLAYLGSRGSDRVIYTSSQSGEVAAQRRVRDIYLIIFNKLESN